MSPLVAATRTPEERGLRRDGVKLMVGSRSSGALVHSTFSRFPDFLGPDDIVVINTSATLPAAVDVVDPATGEPWVAHFSTELDGGTWVVEPRLPDGLASKPLSKSARSQEGPPRRLVRGDLEISIAGSYRGSSRLFLAHIHAPVPVVEWLTANGRPVRYGYLESAPHAGQYQNVYALEPGSAEMPSAGRPFSAEVLARLVAQGTAVAPIVLHTGVSSLESGELPYPERVKVPASTCRRVNETRRAAGRVVAVGTTVVRALESAVDPGTGLVQPLDGWTDLVVGPDHRLMAADALVTGWHEAQATHRWIVEAFAGRELLEAAYDEASRANYLLHEFGDSALFLP
ncbi:MAG TPA: S-adenosylmethionine:tRNA ribosyltransferase-isomerase [Acidimicrobiales bacterium]|nr:S-adenosylmethionine:tRNA ribosyltransferase-isomerase [Acidimicrobiales bacterium]